MGTPNDFIQSGLYTAANTQDEYHLEPGVCVLPLAEAPPESEGELATWSPVVILKLHAPYRIRTSKFGSAKQNNPPVVPTPGDAGNFVFLGGTILFETGLNTTFGAFDWGVGGTYSFVENCVSRPQDGFVLTGAPFSWASDVANAAAMPSAPTPAIGAVAAAGYNAIVGYNIGLGIAGLTPGGHGETGPGTVGGLVLSWGYNSPSFFPGQLLNDQLVNGGGT